MSLLISEIHRCIYYPLHFSQYSSMNYISSNILFILGHTLPPAEQSDKHIVATLYGLHNSVFIPQVYFTSIDMTTQKMSIVRVRARSNRCFDVESSISKCFDISSTSSSSTSCYKYIIIHKSSFPSYYLDG